MKHGTIKRHKNGYTLIELLVGLTIIGILFSIGFVSFRDFSRRQALASATKKMVGELRLAQTLAAAGKKPDVLGCNSPNILSSYSVNFSANSYTVSVICSAVTVEIKTVEVPADITITPPATNPINFKVLESGTNILLGGSATITLTQAGTNDQKTIVITSSGDIK